MYRSALLVAVLALGGCGRGDGQRAAASPAGSAAEPVRLPPAGPLVEVLRLAPAVDEAEGGLVLGGRVPTARARDLLLAEVRRRFPARPLSAAVAVDPDAPGAWVPEALVLLPFVAGVEGGGLVVRARGGAAGDGELVLTGRVASDSALARLVADAVATVAPPFVVRTQVTVGLLGGVTSDSTAAPAPAVIVEAADPTLAPAARDIEEALANAALTFEEGAAALAPAALPALDRLAAALRLRDEVRVEIQGLGGNSGSASLDRALARRRAETLRDELVARGVDAARLTLGEGASGPLTLRLGADRAP